MVEKSQWLKRGFLLSLTTYLLGCQTVPDTLSNYVTSMTLSRPAGSEVMAPLIPGVWIQRGKPKAILDAVIMQRLLKKMYVKKRDEYSVTVGLAIAAAQKPTQAQMVYTLYRYREGWWLTVRVYQVTHPDTEQIRILDVTRKVEDEVQEELNRIARRFVK